MKTTLKRNSLLALIAIACIVYSIDTGRTAKVEELPESFSTVLVPNTGSPKGLSDYDQITIGRLKGEIISAYNEDTKQPIDIDEIKERINGIR